jgi:ATP-dependent helicase IRC3
MPNGKRILFLVHMDELAYQAAETFQKYPGRTVGIEKAELRAGDANIVVASRQTLGKAGGRRLQQFREQDFGLVVIDEVHHLPRSEQYKTILRHFRLLKGEPCDDSKLLLGLTATPNRSDNLGLEHFVDKIVFNYGLQPAVEDGWLARPHCHIVETEIDLAAIHTKMGDFDTQELQNEINTKARNLLVAKKYHELTPECPALFFTVDVKHSHDLAETLQAEGITCYPISGKTPKLERRRLIDQFKAGEIMGLASCQVLVEGFDAPNAVAGHMCRPTKSPLLYQQMVGRLMRPYPAPEEIAHLYNIGQTPPWIKTQAIIVDYVDNCGRHSLVNMPTLFGMKVKFDAKGGDIIRQVQQVEKLEQEFPDLDLRSGTSLEHIKASVRTLDLLKPSEVPPEIRKLTKLKWIKEPNGVYHLGLPEEMLSVRQDTLGGWQIYRHRAGMRTLLWVAGTLAEAISRAESEVPAKDMKVVRDGVGWKAEPPTDRQCQYHFNLDRKVRSQFKDWLEYHQSCLERYHGGDSASYSRHGLSKKIYAAKMRYAS